MLTEGGTSLFMGCVKIYWDENTTILLHERMHVLILLTLEEHVVWQLEFLLSQERHFASRLCKKRSWIRAVPPAFVTLRPFGCHCLQQSATSPS